jgi:hypothetical protein
MAGDLVFPNVGLTQIAQNAVVNLWPTTSWGLYTNAVTISPATVFGSLVEASFSGYARQVPSGWTVNGIIANIAVQSANTITFTNSGGSATSVQGYFFNLTSGPILVGIEQFSGAPISIAAGGTLTVNPVIGDFSQFTS